MSEQETPKTPEGEELSFQTETQQILHLVVHSLYTNPEVFLRELIANASDALNKARVLSLTDKDAAERAGTPEIIVSVDKDARTISVEDNGIGMTREEAIKNLGTVARSGTKAFLEQVKAQGNQDLKSSLIGQFGVGFYSAFILADRVDVETKSLAEPDAEPVLWRSSGEGTFFVGKGTRQKPGTKVTVHLRADADDSLLTTWKIEEIIKKYSDFVSYPVKLGDKVVNQSSALWARPKSEITEEQYEEFYNHLQGGFEKSTPLARMHFSADAPLQYHALLFIPDKAPPDLMLEGRKRGLRLYAKRVLVTDKCEKLVPTYLQFLRGVVDSEDLSLNVSREVLQDDKTLETIKKAIVSQTLKTLASMAKDEPDKYAKFWKEFGRLFRLGISLDVPRQDELAKLLRYATTKTQGDERISLETYVSRMKKGQDKIYYLTGTNLEALRNSPHLEVFKKKDVEVLLMDDAVDEWVVSSLFRFDGKLLESVAHGDVDLSGIESDEGKDDTEETKLDDDKVKTLLKALKKTLGDRIKDVRVSHRLTDSASCLVSDQGDVSPNMERVMRLLDQKVETPKRILEINTKHPVVQTLLSMAESKAESEEFRMFGELLLDQALLAEGVVPSPGELMQRMQRVMTLATKSIGTSEQGANADVN